MKKFIYLLILVVIGVIGYQFSTSTGLFNKPLSPKDTAGIKINDLNVKVVYNRPSKRDRDVFGALVPFGLGYATVFVSFSPALYIAFIGLIGIIMGLYFYHLPEFKRIDAVL